MFYGLETYKSNSANFVDRMHYYPFNGQLFGGNLTFETNGKIYKIERFFDENGVRVEIDNFKKTVLTDNKLSLEGLFAGKHTIKLTLINNLRNLLGPHHLKVGECWSVSPKGFYKENCVWNTNAERDWDEDYCFVIFGRKLVTNS